MSVRAERLGKRYGTVTAVDDLSFDIERGETFALIGPNGSGKSTTLRMILGLTRADSGRIGIGAAGLAPHDPRARRALGYVPQQVAFPEGRSVAQVLGFFADLKGLADTAASRALARTGLTPLADRDAATLSGGMTQRLALAQALLGEPELLVLDEPTASLDPQSTWEFRRLIEQLKGEGVTIVLCSHLLAEVERVADRVLILREGRRVALESLDALRARQQSVLRLRVEVGESAARGRDALAAAGYALSGATGSRIELQVEAPRALAALAVLDRAGLSARTFEIQQPTLEELFLGAVRGGDA